MHTSDVAASRASSQASWQGWSYCLAHKLPEVDIARVHNWLYAPLR